MIRYVGNLPLTIVEENLFEIFGKAGPVSHCKIIKEKSVIFSFFSFFFFLFFFPFFFSFFFLFFLLLFFCSCLGVIMSFFFLFFVFLLFQFSLSFYFPIFS